MQGEFVHDYDSQNYIRYVSRYASTAGIYKVVYIDKDFRHKLEDRQPVNMILSESTTPARGQQPLILQDIPRPYGRSMLEEGIDIHREYAKRIAATVDFSAVEKRVLEMYSPVSKADFIALKERVFKAENRQRPALKADLIEVYKRLSKLERRQGILFRAVEKILKRLLWIK
jgi:hypothetical protein